MSDYIHLCLSDLLDQDLSSQEFFNTLSDDVRKKLLENDDAATFEDLQEQAQRLRDMS